MWIAKQAKEKCNLIYIYFILWAWLRLIVVLRTVWIYLLAFLLWFKWNAQINGSALHIVTVSREQIFSSKANNFNLIIAPQCKSECKDPIASIALLHRGKKCAIAQLTINREQKNKEKNDGKVGSYGLIAKWEFSYLKQLNQTPECILKRLIILQMYLY